MFITTDYIKIASSNNLDFINILELQHFLTWAKIDLKLTVDVWGRTF